jgi:hypothetical protein
LFHSSNWESSESSKLKSNSSNSASGCGGATGSDYDGGCGAARHAAVLA